MIEKNGRAKLEAMKMETKREILTPDSPRWGTFIEGLDNWLSECGCDGDSGEHVHRCAKAMMYKMGGIDVEASLAYFQKPWRLLRLRDFA